MMLAGQSTSIHPLLTKKPGLGGMRRKPGPQIS